MSRLFDFDLLLAQADREGYFITRWDQGTRTDRLRRPTGTECGPADLVIPTHGSGVGGVRCDYTRPGVEPWWHRNPLAVGTFCPTCSTRLTDTFGAVHPCPICEEAA